jgi:hypothetical protein
VYSSPLFIPGCVDLKTPILMATPDENYAAIFEHGGQVAVLKSQAGRCVLSYPVHFPGRAQAELAQLRQLGYVQLPLPQDNFGGFVERFMQVAGFTAAQLTQTLQLCKSTQVHTH